MSFFYSTYLFTIKEKMGYKLNGDMSFFDLLSIAEKEDKNCVKTKKYTNWQAHQEIKLYDNIIKMFDEGKLFFQENKFKRFFKKITNKFKKKNKNTKHKHLIYKPKPIKRKKGDIRYKSSYKIDYEHKKIITETISE